MEHVIKNETMQKSVCELLKVLLANEHVLYIKLRNYHWNVVGPHFQEYHKFFEESYSEIEGHIDGTAERIRTLNQRPLSSMKEFLECATLKESLESDMSASKMLSELIQDYEHLILKFNENIAKCDEIGDVGTEDFLTGMMQEYEKKLWMLKSMNS
ncbi:MAG: Dps family protein [Candidatus Woesearchaeota archaeon]